MTEQLLCLIRKQLVAATPEELVRQALIEKMISTLHYSPYGFALEKELEQMPHLHLIGKKVPQRRADLVYFAKGIHKDFPLYPLLMIECKAVKLTPKVIHQVAGYNHYVGAYFIAIANEEEVRTGWYDHQEKDYRFINFLPSCDELMKSIH